jgi:nicotinamidase-related amidase
LAIPARNAALLLVDVYPREGPEAEVVKSVIAPVKAAARSAGIPTVYVTNHLADSTDARSQWRQVWLRTLGEDVLETWAEPSDALRYLPEIAPADGDIVVRKQHYSGFAKTELDGVLKSLGARDLFFVGFDARICVAATATDALSHDYRVFVLRDAVATTEAQDMDGVEGAYSHAMRYIEVCVGYTVAADDFISACHRISVE